MGEKSNLLMERKSRQGPSYVLTSVDTCLVEGVRSLLTSRSSLAGSELHLFQS